MKVRVITKLEKVERWMLLNAAGKEVHVFSLCLLPQLGLMEGCVTE